MATGNGQSTVDEGFVVRRLLRGGGAAFVGKLITYPLGLILTMVFARLMSTEHVGAYFLAMSLIMLASGLVQSGLATTMNKVIARSMESDNHRGVKKTLRIGIAALIIVGSVAAIALTSQPGAWLLDQLRDGDPLRSSMAWIAAMVVIFAGVNYCCEILRGFHNLPAAAILDQQLLQRLLLLLALAPPLLLGRDLTVQQVLGMAAATSAAALLFGVFLVSRHTKRLGDSGPSIKTHSVLSEAPTFLLMRINNWILNSAAIWVLGFMRPLDEAAMYGAANALALLILASWQVTSSAIGPTVVTLHANRNKSALEMVVRGAAAIGALPAIALAALFGLFGEQILTLVFTREYVGAATILLILAVGRSASTLFGSPAMLLSMTNHQDAVFRLLVVSAVLTTVAYVWAADLYGLQGVAAVTAISVLLQNIALSLFAKRKLSISTLPHLTATHWNDIKERINRG